MFSDFTRGSSVEGFEVCTGSVVQENRQGANLREKLLWIAAF
jgi:hypothetical protein